MSKTINESKNSEFLFLPSFDLSYDYKKNDKIN